MSLSQAERLRFSRQITLPQLGTEGQEKLRAALVTVVGAGGLGSPALLYLAAAGVGTLRIIDFDTVELSNLQRQVIHHTSGVGTRKTDSASSRILDLDPELRVELRNEMLAADNAPELIAGSDVVIDASDNFPTRYAAGDAAWRAGVPLVYGSVHRLEGQVSVFVPPESPCYRCIYPAMPPPGLVPSCEDGGVLGVAPGVIGTLQASEAIKLVTGIGETLAGRLLMVDLAGVRFHTVKLKKNPQCALCGAEATQEMLDLPGTHCQSGETMSHDDITPQELNTRMQKGERPQLLDVREGWEWELGRIEGAQHIPLSALPGRVSELDPQQEVVVYCRSGARSDRAAGWLRQQGFVSARNLAGGILRWSAEVDPSIPRY